MELKAYLRAVGNGLPWLIVGTLIAAGVGLLASLFLIKPTYEATVSLIVNYADPTIQGSSYSGALTSARLAGTFAALATDDIVLAEAADRAGILLAPPELRQRVRVESPAETGVIRITVEDNDPAKAAGLANAIAEALIEHITRFQAEMGIASGGQQAEYLLRTSVQRAELAGALNSYIRSYADLMAVYVSLGDSLIRLQETRPDLSGLPAVDTIGEELRRQMSDTLRVAEEVSAALQGAERAEPTTGFSRQQWLDEQARLESLLASYRGLYMDLLSIQSALVQAQVVATRVEPGQPALAVPAPLQAQLATVRSELEKVAGQIAALEEELKVLRSRDPVDFVRTPADVEARVAALRAERQALREGYAALAGSYISYLQAVIRPALPAGASDLESLRQRRQAVVSEADAVWEQVLKLREQLRELDAARFAPAGPPLLVTGMAQPPLQPVRPSPLLNAIVAGGAAFLLILLIILLLEYWRISEERPIGRMIERT